MKSKKEKIFETYSGNFENFKSGLILHNITLGDFNKKYYCCPLCLSPFEKSSLFVGSKNHYLTLEHVPPDSLGGNPIILTCNKCNSFSGHSLDNHLLSNFTFEQFGKKEGTEIPIKLYINGKYPFKAILKYMGKNNFHFVGKPTYDLAIKQQEQLAGDAEINFRFRFGNRRIANVCLMRIAYLFAFTTLGYEFILHESMNLIRRQIANPKKEVIKYLLVSATKNDNLIPGIYACKTQNSKFASLINFDLVKDNIVKNISVILPKVNDTENQYLSLIREKTNFHNLKLRRIHQFT